MGKTDIEWCDRRWNVVTGCRHTPEQCAVQGQCYARRMANRLRGRFGYDLQEPFKPTFHADKLQDPMKVKEPQKFFVSTMGDIMGDWVPREWIEKVLYIVKHCPQHTFLFLTKNPKRYYQFQFPLNAWLGTTVNSKNDDCCRRYHLKSSNSGNLKFLSIEPLLEPLQSNFEGIDWVILGGLTPKPVHETGWVRWIIDKCRERGIPIFLKSNLNWPEKIEEFPEVVM